MISLAGSRRALLSGPGRSIATLMSGTVVAQLATFAATPVLTRLYSQEAYGVAGVYAAVLNTASVLVTGRYELAIPGAKDERAAGSVLALCLALALGVSGVAFATLLIWPGLASKAFADSEASEWWALLPLSLFVWGAYQAFSFWCNRDGQFARLAASRLVRSGLTVVAAIALAGVAGGAGGLILASVGGQIGALLWLARDVLKPGLPVHLLDWRGWREQAAAHRDLPLFYATSSVLDNFAIAAPLLFMNWYHGSAAAGALNLVVLVLGTPVNLVAESVGQVFFRQVAMARRGHVSVRPVVRRYVLGLLGVAVPALVGLLIAAPVVFETLFGPGWRQAGEYARWLAIPYALKFVISPLSVILPAAGWVKLGAGWKTCYALTTTGALLYGGRFGPIGLLAALTINDLVLYSVYLLIIWRVSGVSDRDTAVDNSGSKILAETG